MKSYAHIIKYKYMTYNHFRPTPVGTVTVVSKEQRNGILPAEVREVIGVFF